ncbi:MAG: DNA-processing protein DprA [Acutalibacteraceae bacterium]|nr:DNA-processing protein DprA [Acutalibacteraceae bacterium]
MIKKSTKNLLIIQKAFGVGSVTAVKIYEKLKDTKMLDMDISDILKSNIFSSKVIDKFTTVTNKQISDIIKDCYENNIKIITIEDKLFPIGLRNIPAPPIVLYIKGKMPDFNNTPSITIVGPRIDKVSEFGKKAAYSLAMRLSRAGFIVVSGAATGCDTFAHNGALKFSGITVGVLGCGIMYDYLPENRMLRNKICENGCLISEYPPYSPTTRYSFPIRNRILSGLTDGTIVVEAGEKSGALNTARHANEQGRDVFVIPGNPTDEKYKGSNELLRDGATPLIDTSDVFNRYLPDYSEKINIEKAFEPIFIERKEKNTKKSIETLSKEAKIVYNNLNAQKFTADDLIGLEISDNELISALTELEFEQIIKSLPGGIYEKIQ